MSNCLDCRMLVNNQCSAFTTAQETLSRELPPPPLGACMIPIVEDYLKFIKKGMRVLDIGCGAWNLIKSHCETVGAEYQAIDIIEEYFGVKSVATRFESLADLSFPDEYFDIVIGNQTMEHWAENGCTLKWGLYQCFRVCKPHGKVLLNVPIHFHGTKTFMLGDRAEITNLFTPFSGEITFKEWGNPSHPMPSVYPYPGYWDLQNKPAYVLDIHAVKDRALPRGYSNNGATSGRLAELLNYPLSYSVYRVLHRAGMIGKK